MNNNRLLNEPLRKHTTMHVGGPCREFVTVQNIDELIEILQEYGAQNLPYQVIGKGSNLLVKDEGYPGAIIVLSGALAQITFDGNRVHCGAGVPLSVLCRRCAEQSLQGLEFAYGIPGVVGGAVYMNAGAYGGEMKDVLTAVTVLDEAFRTREILAQDLALSYRHSACMEHNWVILDATFTLQPGDKAQLQQYMKDLMQRRAAKQPLEYGSAGSMFKRPQGAYAAQLIEECGLKGYRVGDAAVSEKHAGFVVNYGNANFADILAVCHHVQETVQAQTGFRLEMEPEILGEG